MTSTEIDASTCAAITQAARDYVEGWFDGDAERMDRALHADLVKRSLADDGNGVETLSKQVMIELTAAGRGAKQDPGDRAIELHVDHVEGDVATATCLCALYVDYLQLARTREGWKIVNVLWERRSSRDP